MARSISRLGHFFVGGKCVGTRISTSVSASQIGGTIIACEVIPGAPCQVRGCSVSLDSPGVSDVTGLGPPRHSILTSTFHACSSSCASLVGSDTLFSHSILSGRERHVAALLHQHNCCTFGQSCLSCVTSDSLGQGVMSLSVLLGPCHLRGPSKAIISALRHRCCVGSISVIASCSPLALRRGGTVPCSAIQASNVSVLCNGGNEDVHPKILHGDGCVVPKHLCGRQAIRRACSSFTALHTLHGMGVHFSRIRRGSAVGLGYAVLASPTGLRNFKISLRKAGSTKSFKFTSDLDCRRQGLFGNSRIFSTGMHNTCRTLANDRSRKGGF